MIEYEVAPERTALVVVDMQRCFADPAWGGVPEGPAVLRRLNRMAATCRAAGIRVMYTAHSLPRDGSGDGLLTLLSETAARGWVTEGHPAAELEPRLDVRPQDLVIAKPRFGAFHATDLEPALRSRGIDTLIVGGIATSYCVETTVREAVARDFRVLMLSDGTATQELRGVDGETVSAAELQRTSCAVVAGALGEVLTVDAAVARVRGRAR